MLILAIDTCLGAVSVALRYQPGHGGPVVREAYEERQTGHAERLYPMIAEVMEGAGRSIARVDRLAVTVGPGTFTGVRVGVAAARGLALATDKPVVAVSSLEVMAHRAALLLGRRRAGRPIAVVVDARREAVYVAVYAGDDLTVAEPPALLTPAAALARVITHQAVAVGTGGAILAEAAAGSQLEVDLPRLEPHARFLAMIAAERPPTHPIEPLYLREPDVRPQPAPVARMPGRAIP